MGMLNQVVSRVAGGGRRAPRAGGLGGGRRTPGGLGGGVGGAGGGMAGAGTGRRTQGDAVGRGMRGLLRRFR